MSPYAPNSAGLISLMCIAGLVGVGCATESRIRAQIKDYGVFEAKAVRAAKSTGTAVGYRVTLDNISLVKQTQEIEAIKGTRFGIRYALQGPDPDTPVELTVRLRHPEVTDPRTRKRSVLEQWHETLRPGATSYAGFTFDSEWEIVPGTWTFEVYHGQQKLAEKSFGVLKP